MHNSVLVSVQARWNNKREIGTNATIRDIQTTIDGPLINVAIKPYCKSGDGLIDEVLSTWHPDRALHIY